jgi:hypothetical protein
VLIGSQVAFAQAPFGDTSGLFALYAATGAVGVGLAVLSQLVALAKRPVATSPSASAKVIALSAPAASASDPEWSSRPFNAA